MSKILTNQIKICLLIGGLVPTILPISAVTAPLYQADNSQINTFFLLNEAQKLFNEGKFEEAISKYSIIQQLYQSTGNLSGQAVCLLWMAISKTKLRDFNGALNNSQASLKIWQNIGNNPTMEGLILTIMGIIYEQQGNLNQAITNYEQAVITVENVIGSIKVEEYQSPLTRLQGMAYERLIILKRLGGEYSEAFNYVERAKARAFLNQMAHGSINFRAGNDADLLAKIASVEKEINHINQSLNQLFSDNRPYVSEQNKLKELQTKFKELWINLKKSSPEIASLKRVNVSSLEEVQKYLDTDTTLVEYYTVNAGILAFIITQNSIKVLSLNNIDPQKLEYQINNLDLKKSHSQNLQKLYKWLIAPLKPYLKTGTIGIIPHGQLHYIPFAALTDGNRYLIDDYTLFILPSASMLRFLPGKRKPKTGSILALGNPNINEPGLPTLKFAEKEVEMIAKVYNTQPLIGKDATESAVWSKAGQSEILHIAAHGQYHKGNPIFSTIYLAKDDKNNGHLEVHKIYGLDLSKATNLVVLSACETQVGELGSGDEIIGLNRAFMYAGTPSVIASLWSVNDQSTNLLMERFYIHLRTGMGKAAALRQAQIEVRQEYPHPYDWAAFELTGDWKK